MKSLEYHEALDQVLKKYGINAKALSERVGVHQQSISDYRRGNRDVGSKKLKAVIEGLPTEAQKEFYRLSGAPIDLGTRSKKVLSQLDEMNAEELSDLIVEIAGRIPKIAQNQRELQKV